MYADRYSHIKRELDEATTSLTKLDNKSKIKTSKDVSTVVRLDPFSFIPAQSPSRKTGATKTPALVFESKKYELETSSRWTSIMSNDAVGVAKNPSNSGMSSKTVIKKPLLLSSLASSVTQLTSRKEQQFDIVSTHKRALASRVSLAGSLFFDKDTYPFIFIELVK